MQENALKESHRKLALLSSITRHDLLNQVTVLRGYLSFAAEDTGDLALLNRIARCETAARTIQQQVELVIPGEEKEAIFRWGVGKNTGQGLFLAREILAITGIELHETGTPGAGARFDMHLSDEAIRFPDA